MGHAALLMARPKTVGQLIAAGLIKKGWPYRELASRLGSRAANENYISRWVRHRHRPTPENWREIAAILGIPEKDAAMALYEWQHDNPGVLPDMVARRPEVRQSNARLAAAHSELEEALRRRGKRQPASRNGGEGTTPRAAGATRRGRKPRGG